MAEGIPYRNRSPHGWWVATYLERPAMSDRVHREDDDPIDLVWENTIILQAPDRDAAYEKAVRLGIAGNGQVFLGLVSLLPIYDPLGDGTEILWTEHENIPLSKVRSWIKAREELEAFDDSEP